MIKMKKKNAVVIRIIALIGVVVMIGMIGYEVFSTIKTSYEITQAKNEQKELEGEKQDLKNEISKISFYIDIFSVGH